MKQLIIAVAMSLAVGTAYAHEGHDKTPGALAAPHGGMVKGTDHIYLEVVSSQNEIKAYPLDHDMKPVPVADVKLDGKMSIPRKNKSEAVKFTPQADYFSAKVDPKGAHRYDLDVTITHGGKAEKLKFSVEPQ